MYKVLERGVTDEWGHEHRVRQLFVNVLLNYGLHGLQMHPIRLHK